MKAKNESLFVFCDICGCMDCSCVNNNKRLKPNDILKKQYAQMPSAKQTKQIPVTQKCNTCGDVWDVVEPEEFLIDCTACCSGDLLNIYDTKKNRSPYIAFVPPLHWSVKLYIDLLEEVRFTKVLILKSNSYSTTKRNQKKEMYGELALDYLRHNYIEVEQYFYG